MKVQIVRYLIIEHLPLLVNSYENVIAEIGKDSPGLFLDGEVITNLEGKSLQEQVRQNRYQCVFINMDFSFWGDPAYKSPLAFVVQLRKQYPEVRVMVSFQRASVCGFREVYRRIAPDCIVEATDCTPQAVRQAITSLITGEVFYSKSILEIFQLFIKANQFLDGVDYEIMVALSMGTPIKELPHSINLAATTIYKRRIKLRLFFGVDGQDDRQLIRRAREQRFIN